MRIIGGELRGRQLLSPKSVSIRPATDRVRESIFNLIEARRSCLDATVLDLFCGTGAIGLEAISRGAGSVTFVELNWRALNLTRDNAARLGVTDRCIFLNRDALRFITGTSSRFDLVFADPPYDLPALEEIPGRVASKLNQGGLLFLEHDRRYVFEETPGWVESRRYGRTIVSIFGANHEQR